MRILLFDNYDSFTYNLYHYVSQFSNFVDVKRGNQILLDEISSYDRVIFSPGPGIPQDHPVMLKIIQKYSRDIPMLGICLGYQAIAMHFGARLTNLDKVKHGVSSKISIFKRTMI